MNPFKAFCRPIAGLCLLVGIFTGALNSAYANLVTDGNFDTFTTYAPAPGGTPLFNPIFGQIGTVAGTTYLTSTAWTSTGYNFIYSASTVDRGTQAGGANNGQYQSPGQYTVVQAGKTVGNTYMWGSNNSGLKTIIAPPVGTNFIASDPVYEQGPITQTINGLVVGNVYALTFYWAAVQQESFDGATYESWTATLGAESHTTPTVNLASHDFSGWMKQTFYYTATSNSEVLQFLSGGGPAGIPPFALLAGVNLEIVPEFSSASLFIFFGVGAVLFRFSRRRVGRKPDVLKHLARGGPGGGSVPYGAISQK